MHRRNLTFGTALAALMGLLGYGEAIFDWVGRIDFVVTHAAQPGWLGAVMRFLTQLPGILAEMPRWAPWGALIIGLIFIGWDSRRIAHKNRNRVIVAARTIEPERDKHSRIAKWITTACSDPNLQIRQAALFGSIIHDHYPTSDVDLIVMFNTCSERRISKLVREIKSSLAKNFHETFGHALHVTFFCAHEQEAMQEFILQAGKHEMLTGEK